MKVAVLGTGIMGAGMAKNIAAAGHDVVVWNRTRERAEATGLPVAATPQEAVAGSDVAVTMLRDLEAVREAVADVDFGDSVWMQSSTVGLGIEELASLGWTMVDAPVLGTRTPAEEGKLTVLLSGPADARRAVAPVCDAIGTRTIDLGDRIGDASRLKLVLNTWVLILVEASAELVALAEAAGVDPTLVLSALQGGSLDSPYLQMKGKAIIERRFDPQFKLETAHKDALLVRELAARSGVDLALVDAIEDRFARAIADGHGDEDMSATWYATKSSG
ncbi:MAG TPA: NAD(P)-dependent oxidoreductase [Gaiellaceae bacterium]|jgi:3-hydroxyisobutyrate dehydrogenase|nr:NAD(P)-dependent oxidoreductase [Gaiellaceae bacterium]